MLKRDKKGLWQPGASGNPSGKNGHTKGLQRYGTRAAYWLEKLSLGQLQELCANPKKLAKLSTWDAIILQHIQATLTGKGGVAEREALISRIEGKQRYTEDMDAENALPVHYTISWEK